MGFIWTRCDSCLWLRSHRCSRYSRRLGAVGSRRRSPYLDAIRLFDGALQYFGFGWPPIHQRLQHILNTSCARRTRRRCPSRMHWHAHAPAMCADGAGQRQRVCFSADAFASAYPSAHTQVRLLYSTLFRSYIVCARPVCARPVLPTRVVIRVRSMILIRYVFRTRSPRRALRLRLPSHPPATPGASLAHRLHSSH